MEKHFELTGETTTWQGRTLHRILATRDIYFHRVEAGDLGGWVENPDNLHDEAWVGDEAKLCDDASMRNQTHMSGSALMSGSARMYGNASMSGSARMYGNASMSGIARMYDNARMSGSASMSGDARMSGNGEVTSPLHVLSGAIHTSHTMDWTLHRTRDGGHVLHIGCESGTLDHHQALCDSDTWVDTTDPATIIAARPEYQAVIDLCRVRVARWTN